MQLLFLVAGAGTCKYSSVKNVALCGGSNNDEICFDGNERIVEVDNDENFDDESGVGVVAASNKVFLFLFHIENQEKVINTFCFLVSFAFAGAFLIQLLLHL